MSHRVTFPEKKSVRKPSIVNLIERRQATFSQIHEYLRTCINVELNEHDFAQYNKACRICAHSVKLGKIQLSQAKQILQEELDTIEKGRAIMWEIEKEYQRRLVRAMQQFQMERDKVVPVLA